jgi:hypothetical protein
LLAGRNAPATCPSPVSDEALALNPKLDMRLVPVDNLHVNQLNLLSTYLEEGEE